jgi:signal transduction histidine kinase
MRTLIFWGALIFFDGSFMPKSLFLEHLTKDWLLHLSAFITWLVVCYLSLSNLPVDGMFFLKLGAFILFYVSFAKIIFSDNRSGTLVNKILLSVEIITVLFLVYFDRYNIAAILLVLIATQLPSMFTRKQAMMVMLMITTTHFLIVFDGYFISSFFSVIIYFMLQIFGFSAIETIKREADAKEELAAINQELLATRFMLKASSQKQERLRISRDLHDVIGHQLTALSLNLDVASHKVSEEFKPLLQENLALSKTLLTNVRHVVKAMREQEQFDLISSLENLIEQLPHCQLRVDSFPEINSLRLKQQLMFCLQEGVSNALRHGKADQFTVLADKKANNLVINLTDNGAVSTAKHKTNFGSGLTGMRERLIDFNGKVELMSNDKGCTLKIEVEDCYD